MKKLIIFVLVFVLVISCGESVFGANKIIDYGFEDWGGNIESTPGYIYTSTYDLYCEIHENSSEVITSYDANEMGQTWLPHSGTYFFLESASDTYALDPPVPGITIGNVYGYNNVGLPNGNCGNTSYNFLNDITTGEMFIRLWARHNKGNSEINRRNKWMRICANTQATEDQVFMHLEADYNPHLLFYSSSEGGWIGSPYYEVTNAYDGNWHKYSMYVNWNTGLIFGWYDVDVETFENAVKSYQAVDGKLGNGAGPWYIVLKSNYEAQYPTEETYYAMDDIEIWDGMPTSQPECNDTIDNDGDGAIDFSGGDTGCDDANDDDESNCGDLVCEGGETCLTCVSDCPTNAGEVCCSGVVYTGDCCFDTDCISPETCANRVCALSPDTIVSVDSTYSGYSTSVIDDEVIDPYGGTATTWASGTSAVNPHWITINFSQSRDINNVTIYWAFNSGQSRFMASQEVQVQYWDGSQYVTAATITNAGEVESSSAIFSTISTNSLRLWQPANMGSVYYTSIIWLTEVDYSSGSICSPADSDTSGDVSITEIMNYITQWKLGSVTISELMTGIGEWKNGCS